MTRPLLVAAASALLLPLASARAGGEPETPPLVTEAVLAAPVAEVWKVFTTPEGWKALGVAQASVDVRVGGKILSHYDPKGTLGDEGTIENTILAYEPERMLAIRATKAPKGFPFPAEVRERTWSVMTFTDLGDGRTLLSLRGHGYGTDEASKKMRAFFEKGNAWTLERLAGHFAAGKAAPAKDPTAPIEASTVVSATAGDVFRAWTTPDGIEAFLGVKARVELRQGGPFELEFGAQMPVGERGSEGCKVLSWLPGRMFSFDWNAPPKLATARKQRTVVVVELEPEGPGLTRVRLTHHGFAEKAAAAPAEAEEWKQVRAYFAQAWPNVLAALKKHFAPK
jgi:uncharacterized protein YndB with AHSA1/START domain